MAAKRYSRQRELIYHALMNSKEHPTAEMVYQMLKPENPNLSLGTVYRNLNLLAEQGQVLRIRSAEGPDRFDAAPKPHEHLICVRCGKLTDVDLGDLRPLLSRRAGSRILDYRLELHHLCAECAAREQKEKTSSI